MKVFIEPWYCEHCSAIAGGIARTADDKALAGRPDWKGYSLSFRVSEGFAVFEGQDERIPLSIMRQAWAGVQNQFGLSVKWERYKNGVKIRTVTIINGHFRIERHVVEKKAS